MHLKVARSVFVNAALIEMEIWNGTLLNMGQKPCAVGIAGVCELTKRSVAPGDQLKPFEVLCIPIKKPSRLR